MSRSETRDEAVYDEYLAACAAGRPEDPAAVLARHPGLGPEVRSRIEELWSIRVRRGATASPRLERLGAYRLVERLDAGGMGTVFRAVRETDGTEVAVKVLRPELAASATALERLRREAAALARVRHPNVVRVLEFGQQDATAFLALELVPGRGLDRIVADAAARGELVAVDRVVRWGAALARGLAAAHREGVVHRDVKPSNVHVRPDDAPMLLDFGIAQVPESTPGALTRTFAGSPFYAAPEQLTGERIDGRTDVYGLCATLYQCLTGRVPFASDRFEEVMRRTLAEEPVPVRRLAPHVPRDVETIVLAGLEKDPSRRPGSAEELADELERALRGERIRSRRAGPLRATLRAARRRPAVAAAAALAVLAVCGALLVSSAIRSAEESRVRDEAREALREATLLTDAYEADPGREAELSVAVARAEAGMVSGWLTDEELARLDEQVGELDAVRRDRDATYLRILSLLDRAGRLAADLDGVAAARARLHLIGWRAAAAVGDDAAAAVQRELVESADPSGPAAREVSASAALVVRPDPPDAEVHVFRVVARDGIEPRGGRRLVPVPLRGRDERLPASPWALRVTRGAGGVPEGSHLVRIAGHLVESCVLVDATKAPLRPFDRLVSIGGTEIRDVADAQRFGPEGPEREFAFVRGDGARIVLAARSLAGLGATPLSPAAAALRGGVVASVWRDGELRDVELPAGLDVRATAAPLLEGPASRVRADVASPLHLPPGEHVLLLRREGRLEVRVPLQLVVARPNLVVRRLPLPAERPPGCVLVTGDAGAEAWIQDREVTAGEYLEFLNDPATRAAIDASRAPVLVPRHEIDPPLWPRDADGGLRLPAGTRPDHPVLGVSFDDALAYAAWRSARARSAGDPWRYRLPRRDEWLGAACAHVRRAFPFGPAFRPRWASSCYARPYPAPEPVLSFPVDESPLGVFDLCGSAMEWCDEWFDEPRGLRQVRGGSWAQGAIDRLRTWAPHGARPGRADREFGFRLVAERAAGDAR